MSRCPARQGHEIAEETYEQMETTTADHSRAAEAWKQIPQDGQPAGDEGQGCHGFAAQLLTRQVAEDLYTKGWISYPRTETDQFDKGMDLKRLVEKQTQDNAWGQHAQG